LKIPSANVLAHGPPPPQLDQSRTTRDDVRRGACHGASRGHVRGLEGLVRAIRAAQGSGVRVRGGVKHLVGGVVDPNVNNFVSHISVGAESG
jgi:hypothetical protein